MPSNRRKIKARGLRSSRSVAEDEGAQERGERSYGCVSALVSIQLATIEVAHRLCYNDRLCKLRRLLKNAAAGG